MASFMDFIRNPHVQQGLFGSLMDVGGGFASVRPGSGDLSPAAAGISRAGIRPQIADQMQRAADWRSYLHARMGGLDTSEESGRRQMDQLQALYAFSSQMPGIIPGLLTAGSGMSDFDKIMLRQQLSLQRMFAKEDLIRGRDKPGTVARRRQVETANQMYRLLPYDQQREILEDPQRAEIYMPENGHLLFDPEWGTLGQLQRRAEPLPAGPAGPGIGARAREGASDAYRWIEDTISGFLAGGETEAPTRVEDY